MRSVEEYLRPDVIQEIARLDLIAFDGEFRGHAAEPGLTPLPSLSAGLAISLVRLHAAHQDATQPRARFKKRHPRLLKHEPPAREGVGPQLIERLN